MTTDMERRTVARERSFCKQALHTLLPGSVTVVVPIRRRHSSIFIDGPVNAVQLSLTYYLNLLPTSLLTSHRELNLGVVRTRWLGISTQWLAFLVIYSQVHFKFLAKFTALLQRSPVCYHGDSTELSYLQLNPPSLHPLYVFNLTYNYICLSYWRQLACSVCCSGSPPSHAAHAVLFPFAPTLNT